MGECATIGCSEAAKARGLCPSCYYQLYVPVTRPTPPVSRAAAGRRRVVERPYPFEPLAALVARRLGDTRIYKVCEELEISGEAYHAYLERGLSEKTADRLAVRAGLHPAIVWPDWVTRGLTPLDELFLREGWRPAWLHQQQERVA